MRAFIIPKHLGHTFKNSIISLPLKGKLTTNKEALVIHDSSHLATGAAVADFTTKRKHHHFIPSYLQGNGKTYATSQMFLHILSILL
jgi:hypothetical protein